MIRQFSEPLRCLCLVAFAFPVLMLLQPNLPHETRTGVAVAVAVAAAVDVDVDVTVEAGYQHQEQDQRQRQEQQCSTQPLSSSSSSTTYRHLVVLVHGYLGSDREQEYLGEALLKESQKFHRNRKTDSDTNISTDTDDDSCHNANSSNNNNNNNSHHELVILNSKANVAISTDGVALGGKRLAAEISEWMEEQQQQNQSVESTPNSASASNVVTTFSMIGNSLGGLYGRYALAELDFLRNDHDSNSNNGSNNGSNPILPLVFCTTSSPHLGVSQETFIKLPRWIEPHVATVFQQRTMDDLFGVNDSTVVMDMCHSHQDENNNDSREEQKQEEEQKHRDFLHPLQRFRKRIAMANAYKTDFLVSVASGAFLSLDSDSVHHPQTSVDVATSSTSSNRWMKDTTGHVTLQVVTKPTTAETATTATESRDEHENKNAGSCVDALDKLGWHKIFIDTRTILPNFVNLPTPELEPRDSYTSKELKEHFNSFGTLFPIAHPLNMANSKTDLYRKITQWGQPVVDALAELLVSDMVELSESEQL